MTRPNQGLSTGRRENLGTRLFEKLCCSLRAFALVVSIVFYNRIMASCSPSQERQLVLMESMNRRLDSFLESLQQENIKLRTDHGLSQQERL